jgi:hypothetical protein
MLKGFVGNQKRLAIAQHRDLAYLADAHWRAGGTEEALEIAHAHCHLGLGKLNRRTGQREQAQEHLTTAMTMYREMGMTYWLEKAGANMETGPTV